MSLRTVTRSSLRSWRLALLMSVAFALGSVAGYKCAVTTPTSQTAGITNYTKTTIVWCQPCKTTVDLDLRNDASEVELDRAICPRSQLDGKHEIHYGARVRLHGIAIAAGSDHPPSLNLGNGVGVVMTGGLSGARPFSWDDPLIGQRVVVEGCLSRTWRPVFQGEYHAPNSMQPFNSSSVNASQEKGVYVYLLDVASVYRDAKQ